MKNYRVKINGKTFNVVLESIEEVNDKIIDKPKEIKQEEVKITGSIDVCAPIQGNVIDVLVKKGQKVKKGDVLLLIEAMKLENEVNASQDGEIAEILVEKGQSVATNQVLVKMK